MNDDAARTLGTATAADIPELVTVVNQAYRGTGTQPGWTHEAHLLKGPRTEPAALQALLATPGAAILTCRSANHHLLGSVYVEVQGPHLYVGLLAVDPARQAGGIGRLLLSAAEDHARRHGCTAVRMTVLAQRPDLLGWYARRGYQPTGETQPFPTGPSHGQPRQPLTLLVLKKPL
ncbi:GNAT family N-acetyltransferase [Hymenobacter busanensis]|uniref:GNAT family N-acetyltransferase n=1 Tax=Hymenobacter busanensis TaxID=2607656 RepID=A0A7L4ZSU4_9BACT|nr:GNAT family N-acetyltransferase [Hymenobacter busanensis]KAA9327653.1 GNAT family N-acetyltransferase [Hymenobacter busanensis]QHJ06007.1 GNAT family N-acetyltransferase [Hymenobacter busanensis]